MSIQTTLQSYRYPGARALVILHERELRKFVKIWRRAKAASVKLPASNDADYRSLEHLLHHILRAARGYMIWTCEQLALPDPGIGDAPPPEHVTAQAEQYLEHLLERWRTPLTGVEEQRFHEPVFKSRWGVDYCIDAMLEHAVMHPVRHTFQLEQLLADQEGKEQS